MVTITASEYKLLQNYIEEHCGIHLEKGKEYLIETRLSDLLTETGSSNFHEFYVKVKTDLTGKLKDRIVDNMTTNETLWFRDDSTWTYLSESIVPDLLDKASAGNKIRIWSAAASTGQEAYSLLMLLDEQAKARGKPNLLDNIEILGTDISTSALFLAISGRYDQIAISRGLPPDKKKKYFTENGRIWVFDQNLKKRVQFKKFNLQNSFASLGIFDLILMRYVAIYFSDSFKRELYLKVAQILRQGCSLILGATESLRGYTDEFEISYNKNAVVNKKK